MKGGLLVNTIESWDNFTRYYGGIVGSRDCFELACEDLLKHENPTCEVHRIKASRGDGGIDVYVSNGKLIQIFQCKFFIDRLTFSRWKQIENSFNRILELKDIQINKWFLCVPKEFTKEELVEIEKFKNKYCVYGIPITFVDGNELVSRMKAVNICEKWFSPILHRCLCTNAPHICPEYIERTETNTLKEIILDGQHHLLISGIGGIGKTTLAENLFEKVKMMFDVSLWMTYKESVASSIAMAMAEKNVDENLMIHFKKIMNTKNNQRNIIFVDDVDNKYLFDKDRDILEQNAVVIITSRMESVSGYMSYEIKPFSDFECVSVFKQYYKGSLSLQDRNMVIKLVNQFGKSTLLIELFARAANKSSKDINVFLEDIFKSGISSVGIRVQNNKEKSYVKITEHLAKLYSLENITDEQKGILINFSLSGERGVIGKFVKIINASEEDIGDLVEFGWIKHSTNGFYMHALIRECIKSQIEEYDGYISKLKEFYVNRESFQDEYSITEKGMHFDIILNILKYIKFSNEQDIYIFYNLIQLLDFFAYYESLDDVVGLAIQELEKFEESKTRAKVGCDIFNAAGLAYLSYDKAKSLICFWSEKQLLDKFFANNEKTYSSWYCNMGLAHIDIDFEKANQFLNKALELEKKHYGENSIYVADVYHNIGKNYLAASKYKNAYLYFEKAQRIKNEKGYTYSLAKTEFALANTLAFMLKEPFKTEDIEKIRALYISVLEGYKSLNNISKLEYYNTLQIISEFLSKIGEENNSLKLKELIECDRF